MTAVEWVASAISISGAGSSLRLYLAHGACARVREELVEHRFVCGHLIAARRACEDPRHLAAPPPAREAVGGCLLDRLTEHRQHPLDAEPAVGEVGFFVRQLDERACARPAPRQRVRPRRARRGIGGPRPDSHRYRGPVHRARSRRRDTRRLSPAALPRCRRASRCARPAGTRGPFTHCARSWGPNRVPKIAFIVQTLAEFASAQNAPVASNKIPYMVLWPCIRTTRATAIRWPGARRPRATENKCHAIASAISSSRRAAACSSATGASCRSSPAISICSCSSSSAAARRSIAATSSIASGATSSSPTAR